MINPLARDEIRALRRQKAAPLSYWTVAKRYRETARRSKGTEEWKATLNEIADHIQAACPS